MKKVIGFVSTILLSALLVYIFLLSPSTDETNGDQRFSDKDFRGAIIFYTKALANNKTTFSEERILFKLGNSYRFAGENQRAFDFYFSILRKNEDSVYRNRIQAFLRHEAKDLEVEASLENIELESIKTVESIDENFIDLKLKRDRIYLKLLNILVNASLKPRDYEVLDMYDSYKDIQKKYLDRRRNALTTAQAELDKKISRKFVTLWMRELGLEDLSSLSDKYRIDHVKVEDWASCFEISGQPPVDAFFIYVFGESSYKFIDSDIKIV